MARRAIDPRIKLRHILCFLDVARLKSVVRAADALNISQPAASKTVQELEEILGAALFDRSRRKLVLTAFGETFYRHASSSIGALRQGVEAAGGEHGAALVKVGALPTVSARILPDAVEAFSRTDGSAHTRIITGPNGYVLSLLRTGEVDIVIGRMAEPDAMLGLSFEHLYSERVVMAVRPGHPLVGEPKFNVSMIEGYQLLMPTPDSVISRSVDQLLLINNLTNLRKEVETVSNAFGRVYVRKTDAIWLISEGVVAMDVAERQLALLPVDTSETMGPVGFTTRADATLSLSDIGFMQAVRDVAARVRMPSTL